MKGKSQNESKKLYTSLLDSIISTWREWINENQEKLWFEKLDKKLYENGLIIFFNSKNLTEKAKKILQKYDNEAKDSIEFKNSDAFKEFCLSEDFQEFKEYSIVPKQFKSSL